MDWIIIIVFSLVLIFALAAAEVEDRLVMLVYLFLSSIGIGGLFMYSGAVYAGVFHFLVYSGVLTVLFAATAYFVESKDPLSLKGNLEEVTVNDV